MSSDRNKTLRLGVLISGGGTNLQAIIDNISAGKLNAEVAVVISNKSDAFGLKRAKNAGIKAVSIDKKTFENVKKFNEAIRDELISAKVDLVVMAGYMQILGTEVLDVFPNAVINLHPALLPAFMGEPAIDMAFDYGVKVTGISIHFADENLDTGKIIAQVPIIIEEDDTLETLEAKIHIEEHKLLPKVIQLFAEDRVKIVDNRVKIS